MTRGTTGRSKLVPATAAHLSLILLVGASGIISFALGRDPAVLEMDVLNWNFPSGVGTLVKSKGDDDGPW